MRPYDMIGKVHEMIRKCQTFELKNPLLSTKAENRILTVTNLEESVRFTRNNRNSTKILNYYLPFKRRIKNLRTFLKYKVEIGEDCDPDAK